MASEKQYVTITDPAHVRSVGEWYGAAIVLEALENQKEGRLPGFGLAMAIVQKTEAEMRANMTAHNLRAVARAGIDIVTAKQVMIGIHKGVPRLEVEPMDLADIAEDG